MICIEDGNTRSVAAAIVTKQLLGTPDHLIGVPVTIKNDDLDRTFINLKLKKCGTVFATSKSLAMLLKALKRDKIDARFSHVWVSLDDFQKQKAEEKRRKQAAAEKKRQAAAKRKREAAAEKKRLASAEKVAKKRAKERKREFEKLNFTEKFVLEFVKPKRNEKKLSAITQEVTDEGGWPAFFFGLRINSVTVASSNTSVMLDIREVSTKKIRVALNRVCAISQSSWKIKRSNPAFQSGKAVGERCGVDYTPVNRFVYSVAFYSKKNYESRSLKIK